MIVRRPVWLSDDTLIFSPVSIRLCPLFFNCQLFIYIFNNFFYYLWVVSFGLCREVFFFSYFFVWLPVHAIMLCLRVRLIDNWLYALLVAFRLLTPWFHPMWFSLPALQYHRVLIFIVFRYVFVFNGRTSGLHVKSNIFCIWKMELLRSRIQFAD